MLNWSPTNRCSISTHVYSGESTLPGKLLFSKLLTCTCFQQRQISCSFVQLFYAVYNGFIRLDTFAILRSKKTNVDKHFALPRQTGMIDLRLSTLLLRLSFYRFSKKHHSIAGLYSPGQLSEFLLRLLFQGLWIMNFHHLYSCPEEPVIHGFIYYYY